MKDSGQECGFKVIDSSPLGNIEQHLMAGTYDAGRTPVVKDYVSYLIGT